MVKLRRRLHISEVVKTKKTLDKGHGVMAKRGIWKVLFLPVGDFDSRDHSKKQLRWSEQR